MAAIGVFAVNLATALPSARSRIVCLVNSRVSAQLSEVNRHLRALRHFKYVGRRKTVSVI